MVFAETFETVSLYLPDFKSFQPLFLQTVFYHHVLSPVFVGPDDMTIRPLGFVLQDPRTCSFFSNIFFLLVG